MLVIWLAVVPLLALPISLHIIAYEVLRFNPCVLDDIILDACQLCNQHGLLSQERSDVKALGDNLHQLLASIPVLEWFVRPPADDSSLELWLRNLLR